MLLALLADLAQLPNVSLCTTWDARLGRFPFEGARPSEPRVASASSQTTGDDTCPIDWTSIESPLDESAAFRRLAADSDFTYIIAPELDDLLTRRCLAVADLGRNSLNSSVDAIQICSDKWETFRRLSHAGIPTVATTRLEPHAATGQFEFPVVIKPRYGAGSTDTFLVRCHDEFRSAAARFPSDTPTTEAIIQPYVAGRALSVGAIFRTDGALREVWPAAEQHLSEDGRFTYVGGTIPSDDPLDSSVANLISKISDRIPGLRGYVGFDLILPGHRGARPLIVDINPRLTTSYLGYRAISGENLAGRILWPDHEWPQPDWRRPFVVFGADGAIQHLPSAT